jgi:hypothetical protein
MSVSGFFEKFANGAAGCATAKALSQTAMRCMLAARCRARNLDNERDELFDERSKRWD